MCFWCLFAANSAGAFQRDDYTNPVIDADYSDPDVIRVGDDFYLTVKLNGERVYLRVEVNKNAECRFSHSSDGKRFDSLGEPFIAQPGMWIGAKVGLFSSGSARGYADYDWFRFEPRITRKYADQSAEELIKRYR